MSRIAEKLARVQAKLAALDEVMVVMTEDPPILLGVIGGSVKARAQAIVDWYRRHPRVTPTKEHEAELKAGGVAPVRRRKRNAA